MPAIYSIYITLLLLLMTVIHNQQGSIFPIKASWPLEANCNSEPQVHILTPANNQAVTGSMAMRYLIEVIDKEDGSSHYGEINPRQVILEVSYSENKAKTEASMPAIKAKALDQPGLSLIRKSGCQNCHEDKTKLVGPSWKELAGRYGIEKAPLQELASRIKGGSVGVWGGEPMPAHPHLAINQLELAVEFMLRQGADSFSHMYFGVEGSFRIMAKSKEKGTGTGTYLLTASYLDDGCADDSTQTKLGMEVILIKGE